MKLERKKQEAKSLLFNKSSRLFFIFSNSAINPALPIFIFSLSFLTLLQCSRADKIASEGILYLKKGKDVTALTLFEEALEIDSENSRALYGKGSILIREDVTKHIGKKMLIKSIPGLNENHEKADAYLLMTTVSESSEALQLLRTALRKGVDSVPIYKKLARYQIELKKLQDGIKTYEEAIQKYPNEPMLKAELSLIYASQMKDYKKAFEYLKDASEADTKNINYLFNLSKISFLLRRKEEAKSYIQNIIDQNKSPLVNQKYKKIYQDIQKKRWRPSF